ncbi:MAG: hypothetical protein E7218_06615 [Anaerofustis stercorihominis]|nr:hypothetical protein [Anaerofustis stercorihominis]
MKKKHIIVMLVAVLLICGTVACGFDKNISASLPSPEKLMPYDEIYLGMSIDDFEKVKPENCIRLPNDGEAYGLINDVHTKISDLAFFMEKTADDKGYENVRMYAFPLNSIYPETDEKLDMVTEDVTIQYGKEVSDEEMQKFVELSEEYKAAFVEEFYLTDEIVNEPFMEIEGNTPVIDSMWRSEGNVAYGMTADICYDPQTGYYGKIYRSTELTR